MKNFHLAIALCASLLSGGVSARDTANSEPVRGTGIQIQPVRNAAHDITLSGSVNYPGRAPLPRGAHITVEIRDTSRVGASSIVVAGTTFFPEGQPRPYQFAFDYAAGDISAQGSYSVGVRIEDRTGRLLYITDTHIPLPRPGVPLRIRTVSAR